MSDNEDEIAQSDVDSNPSQEDEMEEEEKAFDPNLQDPTTVRARIDEALENLENLSSAKKSRSEIMDDLAR
eukprot:scaffold6397_cov175-Ochromonas_danica.AAC.11